MNNFLSGLLLACFVLPFSSVATEDNKTGVLPLETFYQGERIEQLRLSPNGKRLVALKNIKEDTLIQLIDLVSGESVYLGKTDNKKYKFAWVRWANDTHLLASFRYGDVRGLNTKTTETRLFSLEAKAGAELVPMVKAVRGGEHQSQFQDDVMKLRFPDDDHFLLGMDREMPGHDSVYKINVKTGKSSLVQRHRSNVASWVVDRQGQVRASRDYNDKTTVSSIRVLRPGQTDWVEAWSWPAFSEDAISMLGFGKDPKDLYISANHEG
ncbi:MAG: S9 family peptidase, partial [Pararheinheimera sp.]|nr:S9 family peptidase [Rheinheimera sp.]